VAGHWLARGFGWWPVTGWYEDLGGGWLARGVTGGWLAR